MLKLIGAIMMIGATTAIGISKMESMALRVRTLEAFLAAFDMINAEISFSLTPLPEVFYRLARTMPKPVDEFFSRCVQWGGDLTETSLYQIWNRALREVKSLLPEDRRVLAQAGSILGRFDPENQQHSMAAVVDSVRSCLETAKEKRKNESRVCAALAVASGFALVIIFI
ncbi:MAG: hypothetical protein E7430_04825 [Ruminococcaceae bacterium]|nr:hypothetical protein [Oscillospiraceae bacterium]